jgi:hypothetical protein
MKKSIFLIIVVLISLNVFAINKDAGTATFSFLKIKYSAKASAMGNAFTGMISNGEVVFYNPASLYYTKINTITSTYINYIDGFNGGSAVYTFKINNKRIAVFTQFLTSEEIDKTIVDQYGNYAGNDGTFVSSDILIGCSYSSDFSKSVKLGGNLKYLYESIDVSKEHIIVADFSMIHQTPNPLLKVGASIQNIRISSSNSEKSPIVLNAGLSYHPNKQSFYNFDIYRPYYGDLSVNIGTEYMINNYLTLRGGYKTNSSDWKLGGRMDFTSGLSLGFGTSWKRFILDYAAISYGDLGLTNQVSISYKLQ